MLDQLRRSIRNVRELGFGRSAIWTGARMVFAEVPVDPAAVRGWLPAPLGLASPARATVFIADYPETTFGSVYREAAVLLHVRLLGIPMVFCPWMVVDDDRALILGRELLGYPKKLAEIRFAEAGGRFEGAVLRHGTEVMRIEGAIGEPDPAPPPGIGRRAVNLRSLMSFLPGHLLVFRPVETVHACHRLAARVVLRSSPDDPIGVASGEATAATIRTCDIGTSRFSLPLRVFPVGPAFALGQLDLRVR
jgi:acetoacetate decarboxylase